MSDNVMYYVSSIQSLHSICADEVTVIEVRDGRYCVECNHKAGRFWTTPEYLHDTKAQALQALERNTMEFIGKVYDKLNEQQKEK